MHTQTGDCPPGEFSLRGFFARDLLYGLKSAPRGLCGVGKYIVRGVREVWELLCVRSGVFVQVALWSCCFGRVLKDVLGNSGLGAAKRIS